MRILHVANSDTNGGAARAMMRIHRAVKNAGADSHVLVARKESDDPDVEQLAPDGSPSRLYARARLRLGKALSRYRHGRGAHVINSHALAPTFVARRIAAEAPDIVHLHWVHDEMMSVADIAAIGAPIVWTLHDMWAFSGSEHTPYSNRPFEGYRADNRPAGEHGPDLARMVWNAKRRLWAGKRFQLAAPSTWLAERARASVLMRDQPVTVAPNPLDTNVFKPTDRAAARARFGLPAEGFVTLFGAERAVSDPNKGFDLLAAALARFAETPAAEGAVAAVFGHDAVNPARLALPVINVGFVAEEAALAALYAAADCVVMPSRLEAFGQAASEALACGTPAVAFDASGPRDIIDHRENGYLACAYDVSDLAAGVGWVADACAGGRRDALGTAARAKAERAFSEPVVAETYLGVYARALAE